MIDRVLRGCAWLDEHHPGWANKIMLHEFDLKSPCNCVLGQLYGLFSTGLTVATGVPSDEQQPTDHPAIQWAVDHAFTIQGDEDDWAELEQHWVEQITMRQGQPTTENP